jgi:hypothetical protein
MNSWNAAAELTAALDASVIGPETMNWQGVDVGVNAHLRNGLTVQGARAPAAGSLTPARSGGLLTSVTNPARS